MEARELRKISVEEYFTLDDTSDAKWEYVDGEAFAMAGGDTGHALVTRNLTIELGRALEGKDCVPFNQDQQIATVRTRSYHYPDASVVCPPFVRDERRERAFTSPTVLFEVLSPTTADYDLGTKFTHYRSIDALREYVVIDPRTRGVEHRKRMSPTQWVSTFLSDGDLRLEALDVTISIERLWRDLDRFAG